MADKTSLKYSFTGYSFLEWLKRNKDNLKLLIAALVALLSPIGPTWQLVVGLVAKLVIDAIDYFVSA